MRFAVLATAAAAAVAVPLAVSASGPQMSSDQFLSAVRCTAYEDLTREDPGVSDVDGAGLTAPGAGTTGTICPGFTGFGSNGLPKSPMSVRFMRLWLTTDPLYSL